MLPLLAVALVSAGALAFEVLLTRLFSIIQWHHFAYMVISIALLGYGASGAFLAVTGNRLHRHVGVAFAAGATLFAASTVASFAVAERLSFNGEVRFRRSENAPRCIPAPLLPYSTRKPAIKL